jgi:hypothetical protein
MPAVEASAVLMSRCSCQRPTTRIPSITRYHNRIEICNWIPKSPLQMLIRRNSQALRQSESLMRTLNHNTIYQNRILNLGITRSERFLTFHCTIVNKEYKSYCPSGNQARKTRRRASKPKS